MPIDLDQFESADELRDAPTSQRIVHFLATRDDRAFTRREIANGIDANPETVGTNLTRLKERGLVRHREPYWSFTADREGAIETLRSRYDDAYVATLLGVEALDGREGETAVPDERGETTTGDEPSSVHREAATAFFERVLDRLDEALEACYLFGSVAADTATAASDVDVLAIVSNEADYTTVDDQLLDVAYDVQLEFGVRVEVHSIRASEFDERRERGDPFVRTVVETGEIGV